MKRLIALLLVLLLAFPFTAFSANSNIELIINSSKVTKGASPVIIKNVTYIPLRNLFENINFTVEYEPKTNETTVWHQTGGFNVSFIVGVDVVKLQSTSGLENYIRISGKPINHKGSIYVPIRAFGELFGATVHYEKTFKVVYFDVSDTTMNTNISLLLIGGTPQTQPPVSNPVVPIVTDELHLYSYDGKTYLGKLTTNSFDTDSVFNEFGTYGSEFSSESIWNEFGDYGSEFSSTGAFNQFANEPPIIVSGNEVIGYVSANEFLDGAIHPNVLYNVLQENGY